MRISKYAHEQVCDNGARFGANKQGRAVEEGRILTDRGRGTATHIVGLVTQKPVLRVKNKVIQMVSYVIVGVMETCEHNVEPWMIPSV